MKTPAFLTCYAMLTLLSNCQEKPILQFGVLVKDDGGHPVTECYVWAQTFSRWESGQEFGKDVYDEHKKRTGIDGVAHFEIHSLRGDLQFKALPPDGYYPNFKVEYQLKKSRDGKWVVDPPIYETTLKRIKMPIPMYAINLTNEGAGPLGIPVTGKDCAYDFEAGNWVAPYGNGRTGDIVFHGTFETEASGDSKQIIKITFPGEKDGLIAFDRDPWHGSELRSDYEAPAQGYESGVTLLRTIIAKKVTDDAKPDRNYYFRVRTRLDKEGNIISANFGKIYGDFMSFIYYFNPKPNDRNVEFDPKHNLFRNQTSNQMVLTP
jgi:hypothetical protein